jgi:allophanate hydrolase
MWEGIDLLLVPTAPTHYTIEAMQADPINLNRNLGAYTNFVNLLDYAAISVPSSIRADGLPFGITLIGRCGADLQLAELGQRYHHASGLTLGATGQALPAPVAVFAEAAPAGTVRVAVVGAHLSGMPLNVQLTERGATLAATTRTAPAYRLYALAGTVPPKPGMARVAGTDGGSEGTAIEVEVWDMPVAQYGSFVARIPWPLGIGTLTLADGSSVQGFVCESAALADAEDISHHGGWRNYMASRAAGVINS